MTREEVIKIRKVLGLTQQQFASLLGASITTVSRWELGESVPSRLYQREIRALAKKDKGM